MPRNAFDPLTGRLAYISPLSEEPVIYRQLIAERGRPGLDGTLVHVRRRSTLTMRRSRRDPTTWASLGHRPRREYHTARHRFEA